MLFGHQDNNVDQSQSSTPVPVVSDHFDAPSPDPGTNVNPLAVDPATGASLPVVPQDSPGPVDTPSEPSILDQPSAPSVDDVSTVNEDINSVPDPGTPFSTNPVVADVNPQAVQEAAAIASDLDDTADNQTPALAQETTVAPPEPPQPSPPSDFGSSDDVAAPVAADVPSSSVVAPQADDLLGLKQQAISELSPLVNHLDQTPEEKFRTTMMLIQTTDNPALLKDAYEAARAIPDDKVRAQALLDVVNEINYFTQQHETQAS